jgi:hypothetical protein
MPDTEEQRPSTSPPWVVASAADATKHGGCRMTSA